MKKIFISMVVCLMAMVGLSSCGSTYMVTANYDVCYPDGTITYNDTTFVGSYGKPFVKCLSFDGTNYVSSVKSVNPIYKIKDMDVIRSSTAPMRLNFWDADKVKLRKKYISQKDGVYE